MLVNAATALLSVMTVPEALTITPRPGIEEGSPNSWMRTVLFAMAAAASDNVPCEEAAPEPTAARFCDAGADATVLSMMRSTVLVTLTGVCPPTRETVTMPVAMEVMKATRTVRRRSCCFERCSMRALCAFLFKKSKKF